ncbi:hypothetical protein Salat_0693500 [Sesamum alatum]|uniref:Uncharacterized protein n=1 Tax=Sesamum alatum TaxID=300844 RepID=A0AAE1YSN4_9LAMI|nr:hypothetical protein Salat_0693500 [Sesamum alatum]
MRFMHSHSTSVLGEPTLLPLLGEGGPLHCSMATWDLRDFVRIDKGVSVLAALPSLPSSSELVGECISTVHDVIKPNLNLMDVPLSDLPLSFSFEGAATVLGGSGGRRGWLCGGVRRA